MKWISANGFVRRAQRQKMIRKEPGIENRGGVLLVVGHLAQRRPQSARIPPDGMRAEPGRNHAVQTLQYLQPDLGEASKKLVYPGLPIDQGHRYSLRPAQGTGSVTGTPQ